MSSGFGNFAADIGALGWVSAVQSRVVSHDQPAAILKGASANGADMIALGPHGGGGLRRLFLGERG
jgi:nucleotide-binding universal stress UspA family protein